jgi:hypothetical protein
MAHTLLYTLGYNAPEDSILPQNWDWSDPAKLDSALRKLTDALRPWTIDFHVAQNDATVHGSGTHDKTGRHCLVNDRNGKLDIVRHAAFWLRDGKGNPTKAFRHICWDGCMFPNEVMMKAETWNNILGAMIAVRDAHGWQEQDRSSGRAAEVRTAPRKAKPAKPKAKVQGKKSAGRSSRPAPPGAKNRLRNEAAKPAVLRTGKSKVKPKSKPKKAKPSTNKRTAAKRK